MGTLETGHGRTGSVKAWSRVPLTQIEDLRDAVFESGLDPVQMTNRQVTGSLVFTRYRGMAITSGQLQGDVALRGPLSEDSLTLGVATTVAPGSWHWLNPIVDGSVGIWRPGDEHDALYRSGSTYAAVTLTMDELEAEAERFGMILTNRSLGGTRVCRRPILPGRLPRLRESFENLHDQQNAATDACETMLRNVIAHFGREPRRVPGRPPAESYSVIVARARDYIHANLHDPIRIDAVVRAAVTSERTLYRAFMELIGESPQTYVRRLRLHRIRRELASDREATLSVALIAQHWGIDQPGRLSAWYREVFGESPSQTRRRQT